MSWKEINAAVATRSGSSEAGTRKILDAFVREVAERVARGERVAIPHLGVFSTSWEDERQVRGIQDGRKLAVDGHWRARFRVAEPLRRALRERTPQLLRSPEHQRAWRLAETLVGDLGIYHPEARPTALSRRAEAGETDRLCRAALGAAWDRARRTYDEQISPAIRADRDYLALAARRRWGLVA